MINLALKNGIKKSTYKSRIRYGWSKKKAATTTLISYRGEYAVCKDGEIIAMGTAEECAAELGVTTAYIRWMTTPTGKRRLESRKDKENATTAVKLDE